MMAPQHLPCLSGGNETPHGLPQAVTCFEDCADSGIDSYDECVRTAEVCVANKVNQTVLRGGKIPSVVVCVACAAICAA